MKTVEVGAIGVGWVGGTRVETLSRTALIDKLHICDIKPDRLAELKARYRPATATLDYQDIIKNDNISVVPISTTPESTTIRSRATAWRPASTSCWRSRSRWNCGRPS